MSDFQDHNIDPEIDCRIIWQRNKSQTSCFYHAQIYTQERWDIVSSQSRPFFCGKQYVLPRKCRKAERRKLPLKISRLFEHGQNITLDITFLLFSFCSRAIQKQLFFCRSIISTGYFLSFHFITSAKFSFNSLLHNIQHHLLQASTKKGHNIFQLSSFQ